MAFWDKRWIPSDSAFLGGQASMAGMSFLSNMGCHINRDIMIWRNLKVSPVLEMRCEEVQGQACLPEEAELTWQALHPGRVYSTNPKASVDVGKLNQWTNARQRYSRDCKTGSSCQGAAGRGIVGDGHPEQRSHCHSRRSKFQRTEGSWQNPPIWPGMAAVEAPTDRLPASAPASVSATVRTTCHGRYHSPHWSCN